MKEKHLKYLACPVCKQDLVIFEIQEKGGESIESGILRCSGCGNKYNIIRHIPRFVRSENYASGFGLEWTKHARTQYDSYTGSDVSETRFFEETNFFFIPDPRDSSR